MRVFLTLDIPQDVASQLAVQQFLLPIPRKVDRDQFHITLCYIGEMRDDALEALHEGLVALQAVPFDVALAGFGLFGKARPHAVWAAVVPNTPLAHLTARVGRIARIAGATVPARRFVPHVTLGRFAAMGAEAAAPLERAVIAGAGFRAGPWKVEGMVLYHSNLTPQGPRYDLLARYPFGVFRG
jgi:2'-5' RNA ligase